MNNMIIGIGGAGNNIVREAMNSRNLDDVNLYIIDSVLSNVDIDSVNRVNTIPIIADESSGSGRNRDRGSALYKYHEENHTFDKMYEEACNAKAPVLVVTSSSGGTGSGSVVPLCRSLMKKGVNVIPIIICPNTDDPDAYHLNTIDLFVELEEIGVTTYSMFVNSKGSSDYDKVNKEVVNLIEIVFGKKYDKTNLDSIDDSDLNVILSTPGRFIATCATSTDIQNLRKEITHKVFSGFQPSWSDKDTCEHTFMKAFSLSSMFANTDFDSVFEEINSRIQHSYDEYKNICCTDNEGKATATLIIAGLPRGEIKIIDSEFKEVETIGQGMSKSKRPNFISRKRAVVTNEKPDKSNDNETPAIKKFNWF